MFLRPCSGDFDEHPEKMRQRRETVEHPFGTIKARMGATHFLMQTLPRVAAEMALHVLAYDMTRVVMTCRRTKPLIGAMRTRRETVESPAGTLTMRMGATHCLHETRPRSGRDGGCTFAPTTSRA